MRFPIVPLIVLHQWLSNHVLNNVADFKFQLLLALWTIVVQSSVFDRRGYSQGTNAIVDSGKRGVKQQGRQRLSWGGQNDRAA